MTAAAMADIIKLCHAIMMFQQQHDWRFKAMPVIAWEFADIGDFMAARGLLEQAVAINRQYYTEAGGRILSPHTVEIDCCGVTFRLTCIAIRDTLHGPYGAAEMKPGPDYKTQTPTFRDIFGPHTPKG